MFYTRLQVVCDPDFSDILMAEIAEAGFDSFLETEKGFEAYTEGEKFDAAHLSSIEKKYQHVQPLLFFQDKIKKKNWNAEWEKNLKPIVVEGKCLIRAEFHKSEIQYPYEIIITPKMSFGTGHHQTTYLMVKNQMSLDHRDKRIMDAGCGTAILSIMASKLGANEIEAFDIDEWSVINGKENIENNQCTNIHLQQGKIRDLGFSRKFGIIIANINKNVLLDEMAVYESLLTDDGQLMISGFYEHDAEEMIKAAGRCGLKEERRDERETWSLILLGRVH